MHLCDYLCDKFVEAEFWVKGKGSQDHLYYMLAGQVQTPHLLLRSGLDLTLACAVTCGILPASRAAGGSYFPATHQGHIRACRDEVT